MCVYLHQLLLIMQETASFSIPLIQPPSNTEYNTLHVDGVTILYKYGPVMMAI